MKNAEMKVIRFDANDVIATSAVNSFLASSLGDSNVGNNTLSYMGTTYGKSNMSDFYTAFNTNNGTSISGDTVISGNGNNKTLGGVFVGKDGFNDNPSHTTGNGTYIWKGTKFEKQ